MKAIQETWEIIKSANPELTDEDRALFYTGVSTGIAELTTLIKKDLTNDLRAKIWPELESLSKDVKAYTKGS